MSLTGRGSPLIAVVGATGTGKSELGLKLAETLSSRGEKAEVVGADAMQLYRGMDIGTAKLTAAERRGTPHHLIDVLDPQEEATVAAYQRDARDAFADIQSRCAVPILIGGSGLYVNAALYDFQFPGADPVVRAQLERELSDDGLASLVAKLTALDPDAEGTVDLFNPRRVVRALEVLSVTGEPIAARLPNAPTPAQPVFVIGVREERAVLVDRLDRRVERMWRDGILDEVRSLLPAITVGPTASRAIGYAQAIAQLDGLLGESEAITKTQALTRRYARRQVSWFKRLPHVHWVTSDESRRTTVVEELIDVWSGEDFARP